MKNLKNFTLLIFLGFSLCFVNKVNAQDSDYWIDSKECTDIPNPPYEIPSSGDDAACMKFKFDVDGIDVIILGKPTTSVSSTQGSSLSGKNILVVDNFTIDKEFIFTDCNIMVSAGKKITISPDVKLSIFASNLFCCDDMWLGIFVSKNSTIVTGKNTLIEDAFAAINSSTKSVLSIQNTVFNRNLFGIKIAAKDGNPLFRGFSGNTFQCSSNLNKPQNYSGVGLAANITNAQITYAGILAENAIFDIGCNGYKVSSSGLIFPNFNSTTSYFKKNMFYGVLGAGKSYVRAENLEFRNVWLSAINTSTIILGRCKFNNCTNAITAGTQGGKFAKIFSNDISFYNPPVSDPSDFVWSNIDNSGIIVKNPMQDAEISVNYNFIAATHTMATSSLPTFTGIGVGNFKTTSEGNFKINITNNRIIANVKNANTNTAVNIFSRGKDTKCIVQNNRINVENRGALAVISPPPHTGIKIANKDPNYTTVEKDAQTSIVGNTFYSTEQKTIETPRCIFLENGGSADPANPTLIANNIVEEFDKDHNLNTYRTGVGIKDYANAVVCNNQIHDCEFGIGLQGATMDIEITANKLFSNRTGLRYFKAMNNSQVRRANEWYAENGFVPDFDAEFFVSSGSPILGAIASQFTMHQKQGSVFYPKNVSPPDWFTFKDGVVNACSKETHFEPPYARQIANGGKEEIEFYGDAQVWESKRYLFAKIKFVPSLLDDEDIKKFYDYNQNTSIGAFQKISEKLYAIGNANPSLNEELSELLAKMQTQEEDIEKLDVLIAASTKEVDILLHESKKQKIYEEIKENDIYHKNLVKLLDNLAKPYLNEILQLNSKIKPHFHYESNKKFITGLYLRKLINPAEEWTEDEINTIRDIAYECPRFGGHIVYEARRMLPPCKGFTGDDYPEDCYPEHIESTIYKTEKPKEGNDYNVIPNPNTGVFSIANSKNEVLSVDIFDTTGKVYKSLDVDSQRIEIKIDANAGIYLAKTRLKDGSVKLSKFVIQN